MGIARWPSGKVILAVAGFRLCNSLLCRTFFQPDEYYQSVEIAHRIVFGYGYKTWEWRVDEGGGGLRSPLVPFLYVPGYGLLQLLGLDRLPYLIAAPKITQALIMSLADVATYATSENLVGRGTGNAALLCSLTSLFNAYAGIRTFSNSVEMAVTAFALAFWPWDSTALATSSVRLPASLALAGLAVAIRPAALLLWIPLGIALVANAHGEEKVDVMAWTSVVGVLACTFCGLIDSAFYQTPTFTPLSFFEQNWLNNVSLFYGSNPWHFYLTQGFTLVNWSLFPTVLLGMFGPKSPHETAATMARMNSAVLACFATMAGLSLLNHKELRFLQPLIPLYNAFAARALVNAWLARKPSSHSTSVLGGAKIRPLGFAFRTACAVVPVAYLILYQHQAQVEVMQYLSQNANVKSAGLLMPCHSTPWQSHLHRPDLAPTADGERLWMLTCEPPLNGQDAATYRDQADIFYADPVDYLTTRFPPNVDRAFPAQPTANVSSPATDYTHVWPSHIVVFQALLESSAATNRTVAGLLASQGYVETKRLWNSRWHEDSRRRGDVIVLEWQA